MNEFISVIIPIYNSQKYLRECLESVLKQTYSNIEVILVDDGSTDDSGIICQEFAGTDERVHVIHKENGGLSSARNCGIEHASHEILAFVDSDDIISPIFLETLIYVMHKTQSDIVCCESIKFVEDDSRKVYQKWKDILLSDIAYRVLAKEEAITQTMYETLRITEIPYKMYRKKVFDNTLFPDGLLYEDLATTYKLFMNSNQVAFVESKLYGYRKRKDSLFSSGFSKKNMSCIVVSRMLSEDEILSKNYSKAVANACFRINRVAYAKVPFSSSSERNQIWGYIKKYRESVAFDSDAKGYERILAWCSYLGKNFFFIVLRFFDQAKYYYYLWQK